MNRRNFLKFSGLSAITIILGVGGYSYIRTIGTTPSNNFSSIDLTSLFDPSFKEVANKMEPGDIFSSLRTKGVIDENGQVNTFILNDLSKTEQAIQYQERYYTETELELYGFAYLIHSTDIVLLKGHDLMGGDYHSMKVRDAEDCLQACKETEKCTGFTYAKPTHPNIEKHNSCWLKDKSVKYNIDGNYISGVK